MNLINKFLDTVTRICDHLGRHRTIENRKGTGAYLERYYIFMMNRKHFPINFVIHQFKESDEDDLHDHPWWFFTFIIKGEYIEHTPEGSFHRKPFQLRFSKSAALHRVELINDEPVWTFFMMGPKKREWGFVVNNVWIPWKQYVHQMRQR